MSNLEIELQALKGNLLEMMSLAIHQIQDCKKIFTEQDLTTAKKVIMTEKRINYLELALSKDCENILALYNPVATDLRFVLAVLRINNDLERIGDNAKNIARFAVKHLKKIEPVFVETFDMEKMFDSTCAIMTQIRKALDKENATLAKKVFREDEVLNVINQKAPEVAAYLLKGYPKKAKTIVGMLSLIARLERVGDLIVNVAEELVFYVEAKVLKHKKKESP